VSLAGTPGPPQVVHTLLSENRNPVLQIFSRTDRAVSLAARESVRKRELSSPTDFQFFEFELKKMIGSYDPGRLETSGMGLS
jgi:hypothetical protein